METKARKENGKARTNGKRRIVRVKPTIQRDWKKNTCLTEAVARYFDISPKRVPFFIGFPDWNVRLKRFYRRRGLKATWEFYKPSLLSNKRKLYLVCGISWGSKVSAKTPTRKIPRNANGHAVLYKGTKPFFDSNASQRFTKGRPRWVLIVSKI